MIRRIYAKWLLICLGIGLIPVFMLGVSQGGIALSPLVIVFSLVFGLTGGAIHSLVCSFWKGKRQQKIRASITAFFVGLIVVWLVYSSTTCSISEEYANQKVRKHVSRNHQLDLNYLGPPKFFEERCMYVYEYNSPLKSYRFMVSDLGKIHIADCDVHECKNIF